MRDAPLRSSEVQLSIAGDSVGYGRVAYSAFDERLRAFVTLLDRTVQRLTNEPFRPRGHDKWAKGSFSPLLSAPRAGSFSITVELVQKNDSQHSLLTTGEQVIDDVLEGLQQVQDLQFEELRARIKDEQYFEHFISLSQVLAPDGDKVKLVGLTTPKRQVAFTQPKSSSWLSDLIASETVNKTEVADRAFSDTVRGILDGATASRGKIALITEDKRKLNLWVRDGMDDAVRMYFNRPVEARVKHSSDRNELESITGIED